MKTKFYLLSTVILLLTSCYPNNVIKEIKDLKFREHLIRKFDANQDHKLAKDEAMLITEVTVSSDVKSVQGIEYLENLEKYYENGGDMVSLDLSKNSKLQKVDCMNMRQLSNLQIPQNIETIVMTRTGLKKLKLKDMPFLSGLYCIESKLETLETGNCPCVTIINLSNNELTDIDFSKFPSVEEIVCSYNNLTTIDVSKNAVLESLRCKGNKNLREIICKKGQKIKGITYEIDHKYAIDKGVNIKYID